MTIIGALQYRIVLVLRCIFAAAFLAALTSFGGTAYAQATASTSTAASSLQSEIDSNNAQIAALDAQIAQYQQQLTATQQQGQTLQTQINQLSLSIKKTNASIALINKQISTTQLQIEQLSQNISSDQSSINDEQQGLAQAMRELEQAERQSLAVAMLSSSGIVQAWQDINDIELLQSSIETDITNVASDKQTLTQNQAEQLQKKSQLQAQKQNLTVQQGSLAATQSAQSQLLAQTKSQESTYEQLIAQKKSEEAQFEQALTNLKAQYNVAVNPNQIPSIEPGLLAWPIAGSIRITQFFGNTPFSDAHEALYSGNGHNGVDIAAPIGTPVLAAAAGTILATGNTDAVASCRGGSFGKWIMIDHGDGLNTMYAHLSQILVTQGEKVQAGDVIGYSGETGYATGPHLHFGVYVSAVTQIIPLGQATGGDGACHAAVMPVPPVSGYLNPLNYLPASGYVAAG